MPLMSNSHSVCRIVLLLYEIRVEPSKKKKEEQSVSMAPPSPQNGGFEYFVEFRVKYMLAAFLAKIYLHCLFEYILAGVALLPSAAGSLLVLCVRGRHFIESACIN